MLNKLITISNFNMVADRLLKPLCFIVFLVFFTAVYCALYASPPDYQQGELVRIMYIHVPAAWFSLSIYLCCALCGISLLVWKNPLSGIFLKALIPIGTIFCLICLVTGSIWGRPTWGVYWAWDARLTSMLILLFLYLGLKIMLTANDNDERSLKLTSILAIIGVVNLPVIKFSVDWWNTLHQPASLTKFSTPSIHNDILIPLLLMTLFYAILTMVLFIFKVKTELNKKKR